MKPIAVLDTMLTIRGLMTARGVTGRLVKALLEDAFELATSAPMLEELRRALAYPDVVRLAPGGPPTPEVMDENVAAVRELAGQVAPGAYVVKLVTGDPKDDHVIATALETDADYLVTDDKLLRNLKVVRVSGYKPVQVVTATAFLRLLGRR